MIRSTASSSGMESSIRLAMAALALVSSALVGCSREISSVTAFDNSKPVVLGVKTQAIAGPSSAAIQLAELKAKRQSQAIAKRFAPSARMDFSAAPSIAGEVTLSKAQVLGRTFLYGSDLQYSSMSDSQEEGAMLLQTLALGHVPVTFQVMGDNLQLVADQKHLFMSDINHPTRLINEFPILHQDNDTITIGIRSASPVLVTIAGPNLPAPRSSWVRSIEFVPQGNYLMMETSIELADGKIAEFMESVFPRDTLVPQNFKPLLADPEKEPKAARYRFLAGEPLYLDLEKGRTKTLVADRFHVKYGEVLEWYVTPNIPAQYLPYVQAGVEGWNRYSQKMWGRDFMKFKGILPAGVKIGDPRYNVISWDSVPDAGAAYESQASDPLTGLQSHSLIYLPFSWIKFGSDFWDSGVFTQNEQANARLERILNRSSFMGRPLKIRCFHDAALATSLEARRSSETFARELLKQVLFHEVGHALGLAHNFKGSLSFDPADPSTMFSTSIMDYNQYQLEDTTYESESSSNGPLLEYDRQILSVLYNNSKDVSPNDPVLPTCDDSEADSEEAGMDPLCIRYDAGKDPTQELALTLQLLRDPNAQIRKTKSLPAAIEETVSVLGDPATATTQEIATERITTLAKHLQGVNVFYLAGGAQSASYMMRANLRSLYIFKEGSLPAGYDETALRARVVESLMYLANMGSAEQPVRDANDKVINAAVAWLQNTAWYQGLPADQKDGTTGKIRTTLAGLQGQIETVVFPKMRASILGSLVRKEGSPFFFSAEKATDYERLALEILEQSLTLPLKGAMRPAEERAAAIKALLTFREISEGADVIARAKSKITGELSQAKTAQQREEIRALLKAFTPAPAPAKATK